MAWADFEDVDESDYWYDAVYAVADAGYMTGKSAVRFAPADTLTRAQMVTVLWRISCPDEYEAYDSAVQAATVNETDMDDVADGKYYTAAVNWAVANGVVTGKVADDGTNYFDPNGTCTFQQFCTMLARCLAGGSDELAASLSDEEVQEALAAFSDADDIAGYAETAVAWCVTYGAVSGKANGTICPAEEVSRGRAAMVLYKAMNSGLISGDATDGTADDDTADDDTTDGDTADDDTADDDTTDGDTTDGDTADGDTTDDDATDSESDDLASVYVTKTGSKYHLSTCPTIVNSTTLTEMTEEEAIAAGYEACKVCEP